MTDLSEYDVSLEQVEAMPDGPAKAIQWAVYGLTWDGAHHKQWFLERVLQALGKDVGEVRAALAALDSSCEKGIAP